MTYQLRLTKDFRTVVFDFTAIHVRFKVYEFPSYLLKFVEDVVTFPSTFVYLLGRYTQLDGVYSRMHWEFPETDELMDDDLYLDLPFRTSDRQYANDKAVFMNQVWKKKFGRREYSRETQEVTQRLMEDIAELKTEKSEESDEDDDVAAEAAENKENLDPQGFSPSRAKGKGGPKGGLSERDANVIKEEEPKIVEILEDENTVAV